MASKLIRWWRPDVGTLASLYYRYPQSVKVWDDVAKELGIADELWLHIKGLTQRRMPEQVLLTMLLRGELSENVVRDEFAKRGYLPSDLDYIFKSLQIIPQVPDLISMAVREAWNEEVARRFEYDADFPAEVGEWTAKQGMAPEWAKRYWRAHWQIPSVMQGLLRLAPTPLRC